MVGAMHEFATVSASSTDPAALADKLTEHQHSHHDAIISALHVHLDAHHCLEVVVVKGTAAEVKRLADELLGTKGVKHGKLVLTTAGP